MLGEAVSSPAGASDGTDSGERGAAVVATSSSSGASDGTDSGERGAAVVVPAATIPVSASSTGFGVLSAT